MILFAIERTHCSPNGAERIDQKMDAPPYTAVCRLVLKQCRMWHFVVSPLQRKSKLSLCKLKKKRVVHQVILNRNKAT